MKKNHFIVAALLLVSSSAHAATGDLYVDGKVGVATSTPLSKLSVGSSGVTDETTALFGQGMTSGRTWIAIGGAIGANVAGFIGYDYTNNVLGFAVGGDSFGNGLIQGRNGNVGIGTITPTGAKLDIKGSGSLVRFTDAAGTQRAAISLDSDDGGTSRLTTFYDAYDGSWHRSLMIKNGNIGIGTTNPTHALVVNGDVYSNALLLTSDERYKKNVMPVLNGLTTLLKLEGVSYEWKKPEEQSPQSGADSTDAGSLGKSVKPEKRNFSDGRHYGVLAQDVEKVLPEVVKTDGNGDKAVNYAGLIPILIEAVKEQQVMIAQQRKEIDELRQMIKNTNK